MRPKPATLSTTPCFGASVLGETEHFSWQTRKVARLALTVGIRELELNDSQVHELYMPPAEMEGEHAEAREMPGDNTRC